MQSFLYTDSDVEPVLIEQTHRHEPATRFLAQLTLAAPALRCKFLLLASCY
jgi:hypothetical protein